MGLSFTFLGQNEDFKKCTSKLLAFPAMCTMAVLAHMHCSSADGGMDPGYSKRQGIWFTGEEHPSPLDKPESGSGL